MTNLSIKPNLNWLLISIAVTLALEHRGRIRAPFIFFSAALAILPIASLIVRATIEYEMNVQRAVQRSLWSLLLVALDVLEQNFQQGIAVKSGDLAIYEDYRNRERVGATYDTGERSR